MDLKAEKIILASVSPRRKHILKNLGIPFYTVSPSFEEIFPKGTAARNAAEYFAVQKALSSARFLAQKKGACARYPDARLIAAADTLIVFKNNVYGKPKNKEEARAFLRSFSGKTHKVYSGIAVYNRETQTTISRTCISRVRFAKLCETEIDRYLNLNEWQDAAGAYKIQGFAGTFIEHMDGSYSSIMGLPIFEFYEILKEHNYRFGINMP
ncbi:septum formation protein Maf [Treponema sp. OMZ 840]|uniref:Maf family protein n=1 Tax=Treponema sp. OMZ 840 TaxID=244313 RepID=UPI003D94457D